MSRVILTTLLGLGAMASVGEYSFDLYRVSGNSMFPTLHDSDRIVVDTVSKNILGFKHGDIVVAEVDNEVVVKRIIGVPGDRLREEADQVWVNDQLLNEPYINTECSDSRCFEEIELGSDEYFVMGDNRRISIDSRVFGRLRSSNMIGIVRHIVPAE